MEKTTNISKAMETVSVKTELVATCKVGVTNKQMIPALVENQDNMENLQTLFTDFEDIFLGSAKYTKDIVKAKLEEFIKTQEGYETFTVEPMGKRIRTLLDSGVKASDIESVISETKEAKKAKAPKVKIAKEFTSDNNKHLADLVTGNENWKSILPEETIEMVKMAIQDTSAADIAETLGCSKDKVYSKLFRKSSKNAAVNLLTA